MSVCLFQDINEMVHTERPDWQSVMTYVTAIYKYFETWLHRLPRPSPAAQSEPHWPSWALSNNPTARSTLPYSLPMHHSSTVMLASVSTLFNNTNCRPGLDKCHILTLQLRRPLCGVVVQGLACLFTIILESHEKDRMWIPVVHLFLQFMPEVAAWKRSQVSVPSIWIGLAYVSPLCTHSPGCSLFKGNSIKSDFKHSALQHKVCHRLFFLMGNNYWMFPPVNVQFLHYKKPKVSHVGISP